MMHDRGGAMCEINSRKGEYSHSAANWNNGRKEKFRGQNGFRISPAAVLGAALVLLSMLTGCEVVNAVTASTREKSVAAGSDTWGGGMEAKIATADCPVPGVECWFGRRKVWYTSVRDRATGMAAAEIVRASNSPLSLSAGTDGVSAENRSEENGPRE